MYEFNLALGLFSAILICYHLDEWIGKPVAFLTLSAVVVYVIAYRMVKKK